MWVETAGASRAGAGRVGAAKIGRKVATAEDRLGKETVALGLCNSLPAATVNGGVIAELEEG